MIETPYCNKCGICCTKFNNRHGVLLLPRDIERISDGLNMPIIEFKFIYTYEKVINTSQGVITLLFLKEKNGKCVFLGNKICCIHNFQPLQCKAWPSKGDLRRYGEPEKFTCYSETPHARSINNILSGSKLKTLFQEGGQNASNKFEKA